MDQATRCSGARHRTHRRCGYCRATEGHGAWLRTDCAVRGTGETGGLSGRADASTVATLAPPLRSLGLHALRKACVRGRRQHEAPGHQRRCLRRGLHLTASGSRSRRHATGAVKRPGTAAWVPSPMMGARRASRAASSQTTLIQLKPARRFAETTNTTAPGRSVASP